MSNKVEGLHHLALCTADMKSQIEFFTDKLGMELQALYWMHGVADTWHGFLRLNDESSIAFVCNPQIKNIEVQMGVTHSGNPGANSAAGTMQHLALKVKDHDEMMTMRDRLRSKDVPVLGPVYHGMCVREHVFCWARKPVAGAVLLHGADQQRAVDRPRSGGASGYFCRGTGSIQKSYRI